MADADDRSPVLLFDGVCNLCHGAVQFVLRIDRDGVFRFAALQSEAGRRVLAAAGHDGPPPDSVVLVADGEVHQRSDAMIEGGRLLGFPWSLGVVLKVLPRGLRDAVYRWVARNRYRWFGRKRACPIPKPGTQERFLDAGEEPVAESPQDAPPDPAEDAVPGPTGKAFFLGLTARLLAAVILAQTLWFKFTGSTESVRIFEQLGVEPWGRFLTGALEACAVVLLLVYRTAALGGLLAVGLMGGAILSHLSVLGIEVQDDGGLLFALACVTLACGAITTWLHRASLPFFGGRAR